MRKLKKFLNRLAEANEIEFGKGRLNYQKLNQKRARVSVSSPIFLPSHKPTIPHSKLVIKAMKAGETIHTPKCDICYLGEPEAQC